MSSTTEFPTNISIEPGCYVESSWAIYQIGRLLDQFPEFTTVRERRLVRAYEKGYDLMEVAVEIADDVEERINAALPSHFVALWFDGEFFIEDMHERYYDELMEIDAEAMMEEEALAVEAMREIPYCMDADS